MIGLFLFAAVVLGTLGVIALFTEGDEVPVRRFEFRDGWLYEAGEVWWWTDPGTAATFVDTGVDKRG